jgi:hypothetical protein
LNVVGPPFFQENEQVASGHQIGVVAQGDCSQPHLIMEGFVLCEVGILMCQRSFFLAPEMINRVLNKPVENGLHCNVIDLSLHGVIQLVDDVENFFVLSVDGFVAHSVVFSPNDVGNHDSASKWFVTSLTSLAYGGTSGVAAVSVFSAANLVEHGKAAGCARRFFQ